MRSHGKEKFVEPSCSVRVPYNWRTATAYINPDANVGKQPLKHSTIAKPEACTRTGGWVLRNGSDNWQQLDSTKTSDPMGNVKVATGRAKATCNSVTRMSTAACVRSCIRRLARCNRSTV